MKKLVGLTGKTGAGKSTVSAYLAEKGAYIIDGDIVARNVLETEPELIPILKNTFGEILNPDGTLNRKKLAAAAFSSEENTRKLNSIMHPAINKAIHREADFAFEKHCVVVVDAAAIIESGFADECDLMVVVTAPVDIRKERILKRDCISDEDAMIRINAQKDDEFYNSKADFIIKNYAPFVLSEELSDLEKELFDF